MSRRLLAAILAVPALATGSAVTLSAAAVPAVAGVPVNGPYLFSSPFDSTCGPQVGQVLGTFTATAPAANPDGSYDIHVKVSGTFVTLAGPSVNACNTSTGANNGKTVREGVSGSYVSTAVIHLTSATYTRTTTCPRDQNGACDFVPYLRHAYGSGVAFNQTSLHAVLHSNAPRLLQRRAVEMCSGATCASGHLITSGDIASAGAP
jgi:hypothetical protein